MFQTKFVQKIKTHVLCSTAFFFENRAVYEIMWKNIAEAGQATGNSMARANCMLVVEGYKRTPRTRNTYCFSNTTLVARTRLNVTLYAHRLISLRFVNYLNSLSQNTAVGKRESSVFGN